MTVRDAPDRRPASREDPIQRMSIGSVSNRGKTADTRRLRVVILGSRPVRAARAEATARTM